MNNISITEPTFKHIVPRPYRRNTYPSCGRCRDCGHGPAYVWPYVYATPYWYVDYQNPTISDTTSALEISTPLD